jgi:hypothetical protein
MKIFKKFFLTLTISTLASTVSYASVGNAKIVELGVHRLERLVDLGKADASFLKKLRLLELVVLTQTKPTDPTFKVIASQFSGADGTTKQVEMMMDANGKGVAQVVKDGTESNTTPSWGINDATTLIEQSLHYVNDHASEHVKLKPFQVGLKTLTLMQVSNEQGVKVARIEMISTQSAQKLEVTLNENGSVESANTIH